MMYLILQSRRAAAERISSHSIDGSTTAHSSPEHKRKQFEEQKEFRIILPEMKLYDSTNLKIDSLVDCAYLVPLTTLKKGILIAESKEKYNQLLKKHSNIEFGKLHCFSDFA